MSPLAIPFDTYLSSPPMPNRLYDVRPISFLPERVTAVETTRSIEIVWNVTGASVHLPQPLPFSPDERIKSNLRVGDIKRARQLMDEALKNYPMDDELKRLERLLDAPRLMEVRSHSGSVDQEANRRWMREESWSYRGQWVAVRNGSLEGAASSIEELRSLVSDLKETLVTKVN